MEGQRGVEEDKGRMNCMGCLCKEISRLEDKLACCFKLTAGMLGKGEEFGCLWIIRMDLYSSEGNWKDLECIGAARSKFSLYLIFCAFPFIVVFLSKNLIVLCFVLFYMEINISIEKSANN